jgi:hypothetical protein
MKLVRPIKIHLNEIFSIQKCLKQEDLSLLLFNFASEYTMKRVQGNQKGLTMNETHQLLVYAEDINIVSENIDTMELVRSLSMDTIKQRSPTRG